MEGEKVLWQAERMLKADKRRWNTLLDVPPYGALWMAFWLRWRVAWINTVRITAFSHLPYYPRLHADSNQAKKDDIQTAPWTWLWVCYQLRKTRLRDMKEGRYKSSSDTFSSHQLRQHGTHLVFRWHRGGRNRLTPWKERSSIIQLQQ